MKYHTRKVFGGNRRVSFSCPACSADIESPLEDAGQSFNCPTCGQRFVTPGVPELMESRPHRRLGRPSRFAGYTTVLLLSACVLFAGLFIHDGLSNGGLNAEIGMFCVAPSLLLLGSLQAVALFRRSVWAAWFVGVLYLIGAGVSGMVLLPLAVGGDAVGLVAFGTLCAASALGGVANIRWARERPANPQRGFEILPPP